MYAGPIGYYGTITGAVTSRATRVDGRNAASRRTTTAEAREREIGNREVMTTPRWPIALVWLAGAAALTRQAEWTAISSARGALPAPALAWFRRIDEDGDLDVLNEPYTWNAPRVDVWLNGGTSPRRPGPGGPERHPAR